MDDWVSACRNVVIAGGEMCGQGQEGLKRVRGRQHEFACVAA